MTLPQDLMALVRNRLHEPDGLPPPRTTELVQLVHRTPQEHGLLSRSDRWRFQTMFSAAKFLVAGAIVALFAGFLLSGVLPGPSDEPTLPAAVASASVSPESDPSGAPTTEPTTAPDTTLRTDILPSVELTVEEVEPGLFRVLGDGVRDLTGDGVLRAGIVAGLDGGTWYFDDAGFSRLGDEQEHRWPERLDADLFSDAFSGFVWPADEGGVVDREGRFWHPTRRGAPARYDGRSWADPKIAAHTPERCDRGGPGPWCIHDVAAGADGSVWVLVDDGNDGPSRVARLKDGRWKVLVFPQRFGWAYDSLIGVTDAGELWVRDQGREDTRLRGLATTTGNGWSEVDMTELIEVVGKDWDTATVGPDGTVWVYHDISWGDEIGEGKLARLVSVANGGTGSWEVYDVPSVGIYNGFSPMRRVEAAPDRSVWFNIGGKSVCGGIGHLHGSELATYLEDRCVWGLDIASDGNVWLQARAQTDDQAFETYVITPNALAGE